MVFTDTWVHPLNRQLSQQEIDAVFQKLHGSAAKDAPAKQAAPFDFRRLDRVPKSQLRAIRMLHENFVRHIASSISAYLRSYVTVNLVSVEQLSYAEFVEGLPSPTCLACLSMRPYDRTAILELNPSLTFQVLETVLGGKGRSCAALKREITEIEQRLLDTFLRILLQDLKQAWETVAEIDFAVDSMETEPQFLQVVDPNEAFVVVGVEVRIGETIGMMNVAYPSLVIKMLRGKFDQHWSLRRMRSNGSELERVLQLVAPARLTVDARIEGPKLMLSDLLSLAPGDVIPLDFPLSRPIDGLVAGKPKFRGRIADAGNKRALLIHQPPPAA